MLPERQRDVLNYIARFLAENGYPPTIRDICSALKIQSTNGVNEHLAALEKKGFIQRSRSVSRSLVLLPAADQELAAGNPPAQKPALSVAPASVPPLPTPPPMTAPVTLSAAPAARPEASFAAVPLVGRIAAGTPILAEQNIDRHLNIDPSFLPRGARAETLFALKVQGDSMINASIFDGDIIIARIQSDADNGTIVVARLDETATLKRLYRQEDGFRLEAANPKYEPLVFRDQDAAITPVQGVVVAVIHRIS